MKSVTISVVLAIISVAFIACDGHFRSIYLAPNGVTGLRSNIFDSVIRIQSETDVPQIIETIALDLGMKKENESTWMVQTANRSTFSIFLTKDGNQVWHVLLRDWPTRSEESKQAEAFIRERVKIDTNK